MYYDAINKVGGAAVIIPITDEESVYDDIIERCDGILLTGGADVDPHRYGEDIKVFNGEISPIRDKVELYLARRAVELNKPLLGICRGIQVINVALGGTLYQDIHAQIKDRELMQHFQKAPRWYPTHKILIEKGSHVFNAFGKTEAWVNSFHHQAIKDVAPGFRVTSHSTDGLIESIENDSLKFAVGVQWHPEAMWGKDEEYLGLFRLFVGHCRVK